MNPDNASFERLGLDENLLRCIREKQFTQPTDAKSNEITAIPKLLELLDLEGAVISIDAMGCQKDIVRTIVEGKSDYLLQVKGNQSALHTDLKLLFAEGLTDDCQGASYDYAEDVDAGHGRVETRRCWTSSDLGGLDPEGAWEALGTVACVECLRETAGESSVQRITISSA